MDFIVENYLWIIIFIIVILMAIVGYIAEKTDFIKKSDKPKKEKIKKQQDQPIVIEDKGIDELLEKNTKNSVEKQNNDFIQMPSNDVTNPIINEPITEDNTTIDESLFAPLESSNSVNNEEINELNPIEVTKLEDNESDNQVVTEEEDIWKF